MKLTGMNRKISLRTAMAAKFPSDAVKIFTAFGWDKADMYEALKKRGDVFLYDGENEVPKDVTHVVIVEGVTNIKEFAFRYCKKLLSVIFTESVVSIGIGAFYGCVNLKEVTIPGTVKTINEGAFCDCRRLSRVYIEEGVETIKQGAFMWCGLLVFTDIASSVTVIEDYVFHGCVSLSSTLKQRDTSLF